MLITTSRKPSQRTRTFSKSLGRVLNSKYINRGKMSLRDVLLKSSQLGYEKTVIVSEKKGNPAGIEIQNFLGETILYLDITVSIMPSIGRIKKGELRIRCANKDLKGKLAPILGIPPEDAKGSNHSHENKSNSNLLWIKRVEKGSKSLIEFFDEQGQKTSPRIYVHQCQGLSK